MAKDKLTEVLESATGKVNELKRVSISKLHAGDEETLLKYIMIVKPGYMEKKLEKLGFKLETKEDYLMLPKIMILGLDKKGLKNMKGDTVAFDLRSILENAPMTAEEIKESGAFFVR